MHRQSAYSTPDARWRAVIEKPADADGAFIFAVRTTGVYCRPTCPSRRPRRDNVEFFDAPDAAERAGYSACKRCRPDGESPAAIRLGLVERACRLMLNAEETITLASLAEQLDTSESTLKRAFRELLGVSPTAFARSLRDESLRARLRAESAGNITDALYAAGFGASSRLYENARSKLGMKPTQYRAAGRDQDVRYATTNCALGVLLVARTTRGVCSVTLGDSEDSLVAGLRHDFRNARSVEADNDLRGVLEKIVALIDGDAPNLRAVPLDLAGTAFQQRVWQALRDIPRGRTLSYAELAERLGMPNGARAVARACATNPAALLVPCHRIVRTDGSLGGYRWGLDRKQRLLDAEQRPTELNEA